jgi:hypothetical protein
MGAEGDQAVLAKPVGDERLARRRRNLRRRLVVYGILLLVVLEGGCAMFSMPGKNFKGKAELSPQEVKLAARLREDVTTLAVDIGPRNYQTYPALEKTVAWLETELRGMGYEPRRQEYFAAEYLKDKPFVNLEVEITGSTRPGRIYVVGAHYDTIAGSPGANDNGSGVAATLAIARALVGTKPMRTIRLVFFVNEEPEFFLTPNMGSFVYAKACADKHEDIVGMISLETLGYYTDAPNSQQYPMKPIAWIYPDTGNFAAFVGDFSSRSWVKRMIRTFRHHGRIPTEGIATFQGIPGIAWSDHWSFWQFGYNALMVTDTAPNRYPEYHTTADLPDELDFDRMALVVSGLVASLSEILNAP